MKDKADLRELLRQSALRHGVLPLSSVCNVKCVFCSNDQNPPGVETYFIPPRPFEEVLRDIPLLRSHEKVNIGESATRISEGEPYAYGDTGRVLSEIRKRLPGVIIAITTNGTLLEEDDVRLLHELGNVEVTVSLNAIGRDARRSLMLDREPERVIDTVRWLSVHDVAFSGSMVAMPDISGWDDFSESVRFLAKNGAATVRVFLPGFTDAARPEVKRASQAVPVAEVIQRAADLTASTGVPVVVEPTPLLTAAPTVQGIVKGSPAAQAGLRAGDVLVSVDGSPAMTATTAFLQVARSPSPAVTVLRDGAEMTFDVRKRSMASSGLVVRGDMDARRLKKALTRLNEARGRSAIVTSALALGYWEELIRLNGLAGRTRVFAARNGYFGGNIACAGLLVTADLDETISGSAAEAWDPDLILIPQEPFDHMGRDLCGVCWEELKRGTKRTLEVL